MLILSLLNLTILRKNKRKSKKSKTGETPVCLEDWNTIGSHYNDYLTSDLNPEKTEIVKKRLSFVHGKCSPVLIVAGLMATRLNAIINCKKAKESIEFWRRFKVFCGNDIVCKDNSDKTEMYSFWPNANHYGFNMQSNEANTCFGFFFNIFHNDLSCFNLKGEDQIPMCFNLKSFIEIYPAFINKKAETKDKDRLKCGLGPIKNILTEYWTGEKANDYAGAARGFEDIYKFLTKQGYEEGFSFGGVPYDFRYNYCKNKEFGANFEKMVNYLFEQTGKKVTIVAHSYGNLNSLYQMTKGSLKGKVKTFVNHFISLAPPLTGVIKTALMASRGSPELTFNDSYGYPIKFNRFAQSISLPTIGSTYGLFKYNAFETILKHNPNNEKMTEFVTKMKSFVKAGNCSKVRNLFYCQDANLDYFKDFVSELFGKDSEFIIDGDVCNKEIGERHGIETTLPESERKEISDVPLANVCWYKLFDFENCSSIAMEPQNYDDVEKSISSKDSYLKHILCNLYPKDLKHYETFRQKKDLPGNMHDFMVYDGSFVDFPERKENNSYFNTSEPGKKNIFDFVKEKTILPNVFAEFHDIMGKHIRNIPPESKDYLPQLKESIISSQLFTRQNLKNSVDQNSKNCKEIDDTIEDLPHPGVRVTGIFNRSFETKAAFLAKSEFDNREQTRDKVFYSGGDGTVDAESAITPFFKWAFEAKYLDKPKVDLFDYCPGLEKTSKWYYKTYDTIKKEKNNYKLLKCKCVDDEGKFLKDVSPCAHAGMLDDPSISQVILDVVSSYESDTPLDTFEIIFNRVIKNYDTLSLCFDIFNKIYFPVPNQYAPENIYNYVKDTNKKLKKRKRSNKF